MPILRGSGKEVYKEDLSYEGAHAFGVYFRWKDGTERIYEYMSEDESSMTADADYFADCASGGNLTQLLRDYPFETGYDDEKKETTFSGIVTNSYLYGRKPKYKLNYEQLIQSKVPEYLVLYFDMAFDGEHDLSWHAAEISTGRGITGRTNQLYKIRELEGKTLYGRPETEPYLDPSKESVLSTVIDNLRQADAGGTANAEAIELPKTEAGIAMAQKLARFQCLDVQDTTVRLASLAAVYPGLTRTITTSAGTSVTVQMGKAIAGIEEAWKRILADGGAYNLQEWKRKRNAYYAKHPMSWDKSGRDVEGEESGSNKELVGESCVYLGVEQYTLGISALKFAQMVDAILQSLDLFADRMPRRKKDGMLLFPRNQLIHLPDKDMDETIQDELLLYPRTMLRFTLRSVSADVIEFSLSFM